MANFDALNSAHFGDGRYRPLKWYTTEASAKRQATRLTDSSGRDHRWQRIDLPGKPIFMIYERI